MSGPGRPEERVPNPGAPRQVRPGSERGRTAAGGRGAAQASGSPPSICRCLSTAASLNSTSICS